MVVLRAFARAVADASDCVFRSCPLRHGPGSPCASSHPDPEEETYQ